MKKKYKYPPYKARYKFDRVAILKDFQFLHQFTTKYGIADPTFRRGITKLENHPHIPTKYLIDTQKVKATILLGECIILAKNEDEATHLLEVRNSKVVLKAKE